MKNVGEIFGEIAEKLGIPTDHKGIKDLLSLTSPVDAEIYEKIESLVTVEQAKKLPVVKNHIIANFADGLETGLIEKLNKLGADEGILDAVRSEKNIGKKFETAIQKFKDLKEESSDKGTTKEYNDKIRDLNAQLSQLKETHVPREEVEKLSGEIETERLNLVKEKEFGRLNWSSVYKEDPDKYEYLNMKLNKELAAMDGKLIRTKDGTRLVSISNPDQELYDKNNKPVVFSQLVDSIASRNNFIAVTNQVQDAVKTTVVAPTSTPVARANNATLKALQESKADMGL